VQAAAGNAGSCERVALEELCKPMDSRKDYEDLYRWYVSKSPEAQAEITEVSCLWEKSPKGIFRDNQYKLIILGWLCVFAAIPLCLIAATFSCDKWPEVCISAINWVDRIGGQFFFGGPRHLISLVLVLFDTSVVFGWTGYILYKAHRQERKLKKRFLKEHPIARDIFDIPSSWREQLLS
jgi:hypothetical protein